jgi:hypothetical protein
VLLGLGSSSPASRTAKIGAAAINRPTAIATRGVCILGRVPSSPVSRPPRFPRFRLLQFHVRLRLGPEPPAYWCRQALGRAQTCSTLLNDSYFGSRRPDSRRLGLPCSIRRPDHGGRWVSGSAGCPALPSQTPVTQRSLLYRPRCNAPALQVQGQARARDETWQPRLRRALLRPGASHVRPTRKAPRLYVR